MNVQEQYSALPNWSRNRWCYVQWLFQNYKTWHTNMKANILFLQDIKCSS